MLSSKVHDLLTSYTYIVYIIHIRIYIYKYIHQFKRLVASFYFFIDLTASLFIFKLFISNCIKYCVIQPSKNNYLN